MFISQTTDFHFANYRFSFRKLQIFISQTTDFHFANYRFSFRKLQISISQSTDFHFANYRFPFPFRFVPFRFANYSKPERAVLYYVCYLQYRLLSMNCTRKLVYQLVAWKGKSQLLNCPQKMVLLLKMLTDRLLETTKITPMTAQGGLLIFVRLRGGNILSSVWNSKS